VPSITLVPAQFNDLVQFKESQNLFALNAQHGQKKCTINQLDSPGLIATCIFMQIILMISVEVTQSRKVSYSSSCREGGSCLITTNR